MEDRMSSGIDAKTIPDGSVHLNIGRRKERISTFWKRGDGSIDHSKKNFVQENVVANTTSGSAGVISTNDVGDIVDKFYKEHKSKNQLKKLLISATVFGLILTITISLMGYLVAEKTKETKVADDGSLVTAGKSGEQVHVHANGYHTNALEVVVDPYGSSEEDTVICVLLDEVAKIYHESAMATNVAINIRSAATGKEVGLLRVPTSSAKVGDTHIQFGDNALTFDLSDTRCDDVLNTSEGRRLLSEHSAKDLFHQHLEAVQNGRSLKSTSKNKYVSVNTGGMQSQCTAKNTDISTPTLCVSDVSDVPCIILDDSGTMEIKIKDGVCSGDEFLNELSVSDSCDYAKAVLALKAITDTTTLSDAKASVDELCDNYFKSLGKLDMEFALTEGSENLEAFFNGRSYVDINVEKNDGDFSLRNEDLKMVRALYEYSQNAVIPFPKDIKNFADCKLRAVYCCFTKDRQANDNNGNCAKPYEQNCIDRIPGYSSSVCSMKYSHFKNRASVCRGFAWGNDPRGLDYRFRGNNLFYTALYSTAYLRGFVSHAPDAPKCGCAEKMPIIKNARCDKMEISMTVAYKYVVMKKDMKKEGCLSVQARQLMIEYKSCTDLEDYYKDLVVEGLATEAELTQLQKKIVGNCD